MVMVNINWCPSESHEITCKTIGIAQRKFGINQKNLRINQRGFQKCFYFETEILKPRKVWKHRTVKIQLGYENLVKLNTLMMSLWYIFQRCLHLLCYNNLYSVGTAAECFCEDPHWSSIWLILQANVRISCLGKV